MTAAEPPTCATPDWDRPILANQILGGYSLDSLACSGSLVQGVDQRAVFGGGGGGRCLVEGVLTGRTEAGQAFPSPSTGLPVAHCGGEGFPAQAEPARTAR